MKHRILMPKSSNSSRSKKATSGSSSSGGSQTKSSKASTSQQQQQASSSRTKSKAQSSRVSVQQTTSTSQKPSLFGQLMMKELYGGSGGEQSVSPLKLTVSSNAATSFSGVTSASKSKKRDAKTNSLPDSSIKPIKVSQLLAQAERNASAQHTQRKRALYASHQLDSDEEDEEDLDEDEMEEGGVDESTQSGVESGMEGGSSMEELETTASEEDDLEDEEDEDDDSDESQDY